MTPNPSAAVHLSPSVYHRHVLDHTPQALAYRGGDVAAWQANLRDKLLQLLGPLGTEPRGPLNVRSLWKREHELGTIEKIVFNSEPYADVPAFLCLPRSAPPPYDWFICLQGHSTGMHNSIRVQRDDNTAPHEVQGDRDFALGCMARGIAALAIEQRCLGERCQTVQKQPNPRACTDSAMQALLLGRTLIGQRIYDVDRAIDYLATRNDVRMQTLGVMGNSGGGTTSLVAAAALPRVRLAMPSCYFCTFRDSIMAMHHCPCNYVPGLLCWAEMADIMGLFAPRPVVIVAGEMDDIFPIAGVRESFERLRAIYAAAGAAHRCHLVVGPEGHRFYADLAWPAMLGELARVKAKCKVRCDSTNG